MEHNLFGERYTDRDDAVDALCEDYLIAHGWCHDRDFLDARRDATGYADSLLRHWRGVLDDHRLSVSREELIAGFERLNPHRANPAKE